MTDCATSTKDLTPGDNDTVVTKPMQDMATVYPSAAEIAEARSKELWEKIRNYHTKHALHADYSLEGKSTEYLIQYMIHQRGFEEALARSVVASYPPHLLAKIRRTSNELPTARELCAAADEEWDEKSYLEDSACDLR